MFFTLLAAHAMDPCLPGADCDGDGYTESQGDCDDEDPLVSPAAFEDCNTTLDDDCDGLYNEECDRDAAQGQLRGGSTCNDTGGSAAWLVLAPLFWVRRRS